MEADREQASNLCCTVECNMLTLLCSGATVRLHGVRSLDHDSIPRHQSRDTLRPHHGIIGQLSCIAWPAVVFGFSRQSAAIRKIARHYEGEHSSYVAVHV